MHIAERERERSKSWLWIILGVVLVSGIEIGIYFFTKSSENKNPDHPNTHYLPNEQEFQQKVDQLKSKKGIGRIRENKKFFFYKESLGKGEI